MMMMMATINSINQLNSHVIILVALFVCLFVCYLYYIVSCFWL